VISIELIPALQDNYIFTVKSGKNLLVVDPGSADEVSQYANERELKPTHILVTHHHYDHVDGIASLQSKTGAAVYGPESLAQKGFQLNYVINDGDEIEFGEYKFLAMHLPGHTLDQICYFEKSEKVLFCGDTLFSLGCGRLFEGTPEQMFNSLQLIKALPPETKIYGAHEYTLKNIEFSIEYLLSQSATEKVLRPYRSLHEQIAVMRTQNQPTLPSRLDFELKYNLFLKAETLEEFKMIRAARNAF
jgi:hydroxyacylglutathione hydrolase